MFAEFHLCCLVGAVKFGGEANNLMHLFLGLLIPQRLLFSGLLQKTTICNRFALGSVEKVEAQPLCKPIVKRAVKVASIFEFSQVESDASFANSCKPFVWADLSTYNPFRSMSFYKNVFGWDFHDLGGYQIAMHCSDS